MSVPTTLMSMYSISDQIPGYGDAIAFEKVGVAPTNANISNDAGVGIKISEPGIYEISYGVHSPNGGLFCAMDTQIQNLIKTSILSVGAGQSGSISFFYHVFPTPGIAIIQIISLGGNIDTILINGNYSVSAYLNVKKISN